MNIMKHSPSQVPAVEGGGLDVEQADNDASQKDAQPRVLARAIPQSATSSMILRNEQKDFEQAQAQRQNAATNEPTSLRYGGQTAGDMRAAHATNMEERAGTPYYALQMQTRGAGMAGGNIGGANHDQILNQTGMTGPAGLSSNISQQDMSQLWNMNGYPNELILERSSQGQADIEKQMRRHQGSTVGGHLPSVSYEFRPSTNRSNDALTGRPAAHSQHGHNLRSTHGTTQQNPFNQTNRQQRLLQEQQSHERVDKLDNIIKSMLILDQQHQALQAQEKLLRESTAYYRQARDGLRDGQGALFAENKRLKQMLAYL